MRYAPLAALALMAFAAGCGGQERPGPQLRKVTADDLRAVIGDGQAELTVVNLWATWCIPCRKEFPDLIRIGTEFADKEVRVVFVSTDSEEQEADVKGFLADMNVSWDTYLKEGDGYDFVQALYSEWSGALPTTFIYSREGELLEHWEGISTYEELRSRLDTLLAS